VAFLHFLRRGRRLAAGLAGACAALTYPLGVTLAVAGAAWILLAVRRHRARTIAASCVPSALAFLAVLAVQRAQPGRWTASFDVECTHEHGRHTPTGGISIYRI